jgi:hypothetical protein
MKYIKWFFWKIWYLFIPESRDLLTYLIKLDRIRSPWWKFKPSMYHNDDGKEWEIWFEHEQGYTEKRTIQVEAVIGMDTGNIVGITIFDEVLKKK